MLEVEISYLKKIVFIIMREKSIIIERKYNMVNKFFI